MRVGEHQCEERGGAAGEAGRCAGLDVDQHRVLIGRRQLVNARAARRPRVAIERREAGRVRLARRGERAAERAIDVVRGPRLRRARAVRVGRDQPRDDRLEQVGFGRGEALERGALRAGLHRR